MLPSCSQAAVSEMTLLIGGTSAHLLRSSSNADIKTLLSHHKFLICFFLIESICKTSHLSTYLSFAFGSMTTASFYGSLDWSEETVCREMSNVG